MQKPTASRDARIYGVEHQLKVTALLERVYFGWSDFLMSESRSSFLRSRAERGGGESENPESENPITNAKYYMR